MDCVPHDKRAKKLHALSRAFAANLWKASARMSMRVLWVKSRGCCTLAELASFSYNCGMNIELRLEEEADWDIVENLTREAFWNLHVPGCDEHLLVRNLRKAKEFVKGLSFVAAIDGKIVGNIVYAETKIADGEREHAVLTFGPLSVLPEYQNMGIGTKLIEHTKRLAKEMGYRAILIYGYPEYYVRFGFRPSRDFGITDGEDRYLVALQVLELYSSALSGIAGRFDQGELYSVDAQKLAEFEKGFAPKEKGWAKTQERFRETSAQYLQ